jgi:hypothetical protein
MGVAGGDKDGTKPPTVADTGLQSIKIPAGCEGLQAEAELCTWGVICETIKDAQFPSCDYDCSTCTFSTSEEKEELEGDNDENAVENSEEDKFPGSCSILKSELRLCSWGPSCQTIRDAQYPECNYNCDTCTLESSQPQVSPVVADDNWGDVDSEDVEDGVPDVDSLNVWKPLPIPAAVEAEEEIPEECLQLDSEINLCSWGPSCKLIKDTQFPQCNYNCDTCELKSSGIEEEYNEDVTIIEDEHLEIDEGVDSEEDEKDDPVEPPPTAASTAQEELLNLWEEFRPTNHHCNSAVCQVETAAWGQRPPTSASTAESSDESDDEFTWSDFDTDKNNCTAVTGPGAGKTCKFPFKHDGVTYHSCAFLLLIENKNRSENEVVGWCSTKVDINGIHITGPSYDKWQNVGFCDESCFEE